MAELAKKLYIKKGDIQQAASLYTTTAEAGTAHAHLWVDDIQTFLPLGEPTDVRATIGRIKGISGQEFAILTSEKPPYHKDSYTNAGTYTWTCPADVMRARVTVAGGGAGGCTTLKPNSLQPMEHPGGSGALITTTVSVSPNSSYSIIVGAGGANGSLAYAKDGGTSSALGIQAQGGKGYQGPDSPQHSYGNGGAGGADGKTAGGTGWVYIEYGGDI